MHTKERCHPEAASADQLPPKDLVLTELFLGQRGACTMKSAVNHRKILINCFVCTFIYKIRKSLCNLEIAQ